MVRLIHVDEELCQVMDDLEGWVHDGMFDKPKMRKEKPRRRVIEVVVKLPEAERRAVIVGRALNE